MRHPKLRDSSRLHTHELYPTNELNDETTLKIGQQVAYLKCVGRKDISGTDWGEIFAEAIGGTHLDSPVGIADVTCEKMAWSMKTVKKQRPVQNKLRKADKRTMPTRLLIRHNRPAQRLTRDRKSRARDMERKNKHSSRLLQPYTHDSAHTVE